MLMRAVRATCAGLGVAVVCLTGHTAATSRDFSQHQDDRPAVLTAEAALRHAGLSPSQIDNGTQLVAAAVADLDADGDLEQYEVDLDPVRMTSYGVTMQQVVAALGRGNANAGGSYIERGEQQYIVRGIGLRRSIDDLGEVVVAERSGVPVLVSSIADVKEATAPRQGITGQDG